MTDVWRGCGAAAWQRWPSARLSLGQRDVGPCVATSGQLFADAEKPAAAVPGGLGRKELRCCYLLRR
jgi:hypothetical protein